VKRGPHALVIGGTGMLRGVCVELARRGWTVSVVARRHGPLGLLAREAPGVVALPADYREAQELAARVRASVQAHRPVTLVLAWVRSDAAGALELIAELVGACRFVHVVGSAGADPSGVRDEEVARMQGVDYRRVVLGFVPEEGSSRWLTDEEICAGVLRAVDGEESESVVGVVRPWDKRPR
jgi:NAD(P)-dependent dehydrogenase (short-subunit alcohol dehydrogenase family)